MLFSFHLFTSVLHDNEVDVPIIHIQLHSLLFHNARCSTLDAHTSIWLNDEPRVLRIDSFIATLTVKQFPEIK